jgi:hypothetical protein
MEQDAASPVKNADITDALGSWGASAGGHGGGGGGDAAVPTRLLLTTPQYRPYDAPTVFYGNGSNGSSGSQPSGGLLSAEEKISELMRVLESATSDRERLARELEEVQAEKVCGRVCLCLSVVMLRRRCVCVPVPLTTWAYAACSSRMCGCCEHILSAAGCIARRRVLCVCVSARPRADERRRVAHRAQVSMEYLLREKLEKLVQSQIEARMAALKKDGRSDSLAVAGIKVRAVCACRVASCSLLSLTPGVSPFFFMVSLSRRVASSRIGS